MAIDLKAIDRKIRKLQRFRDFAKELDGDPEFLELISEFATKTDPAPKPATSAGSHAGSNGNGNGSERPRGYFVGAVRGAVMQLGPEFTSREVEKVIREQGIEILAANPNIAINDALGTLEKRGELTRRGKRGVQVIWKKAISAVESRTA
ncbi:MAG: hypothetical protein ABSA78_13475 [Candidatus Sulfotelmatobacter sp.]|jgi:hypothetical protein